MAQNLDAADLTAWVERAKGFDADAWDVLYRQAYPRLLAYCRRRLRHDQDADDAVAEVMARAIARIDTFRSGVGGPGGFEGWLFAIGRNVVHERWRDRERDVRWRRAGRRLAPVPTTDPADGLLLDEEHEAVRAAFDELSDQDREVLELRVVRGLDADAVGVVLGKGAGAVRTAQCRALDRLRSRLRPGIAVRDRADGTVVARAELA